METPTVAGGRSRGARSTPGSGRRRSAVKTPKSVLTPNDDAAEKASVRRKRRSQALRLSLSDAFAGHADQQASQDGQQTQAGPAGQGSSSKPMLSEEARNNLLEQCLKLATENKITDRNAWHLDLISHLPDIVGSGPAARAQHSSSSSFNFQKMSGGLDAGVTIYARRVELTYKSARSLGCYAPGKQQGDDAEGDDGYENEGGDDDDGLDDAAAAAAKAQAKHKGRGRQGGGSADEEATLTTPDHLRAKKGDATFAVDPLFHTMSALFDEGGAKGLLLLNRSVYSGAHIMTDAQDVPEQQFPLTQTQGQQQHQDVLLDLRPLQTQLTACSSGGSTAAASVLTPGLQQLYALLEETRRALPGYKRQQQPPASASGGGVEVAGIMQQALRNLPPNPLPKRLHTAQAGAAAAPASFAAADAGMADADGTADSFPDASPGTDAADTDMQQDGDHSCGSGAGEGPVSGSLPVVASFLASCEAAAVDEEDDAAAADEGYRGEFDEGHPGDGDEGDSSSWGGHQQQDQQQQQKDRQSLLGLGGAGQDPDQEGACGLDAEALQQLLGAAAGQQPGSKGGTTAGSGWAGSRFWKYRSAAAATARMAAGGSSSSGGAVKRAAAATSKGRSSSSSSSSRIDFTCRPADLSAAVAPGDPRKTRLVSAPSASTADTLLPEDLRYQASSLLQLFLRPSPISFGRQQQQQQQGRGSHSTGDGQLPAWAEEGGGAGEGGEGWGGDEYGYSDDGDAFGSGTGAEGYNAGDLSVGDPGFSSVGGAGGVSGSGGSEWWSAEGELLSAPQRMAGGGVKYQRSAKQVDVRALKDLLWDSLVTVNSEQQQQQADSNSRSPASSAPQAADSSAAVIPFQDVIVAVLSDSAAGPLEDVSVHMCFICLLHLANEKGLVVRAQEDLKTLTISNVQQ